MKDKPGPPIDPQRRKLVKKFFVVLLASSTWSSTLALLTKLGRGETWRQIDFSCRSNSWRQSNNI